MHQAAGAGRFTHGSADGVPSVVVPSTSSVDSPPVVVPIIHAPPHAVARSVLSLPRSASGGFKHRQLTGHNQNEAAALRSFGDIDRVVYPPGSSVTLGRPGGLRQVNPIPAPSSLADSSTSSGSVAISALGLENLDLRGLDPVTAQRLLDEIREGADLRDVLRKLRALDSGQKRLAGPTRSSPPPPPPKRSDLLHSSEPSPLLPRTKERVVTFEDETEAAKSGGDVLM